MSTDAFATIVGAIISIVSLVSAGYFVLRTIKRQEGESQRSYEALRDEQDDPDQRRFLLLAQYHSTSLSQSKISFWFSLLFASLGFVVIVMPIVFSYLRDSGSNGSIVNDAQILNLLSGTIIEAVAALFFVQSNRARRLMVEFFDRLRADKKLDDALRLATEIGDDPIQNRLKVLLALDFADVRAASDEGVLSTALRQDGFLGAMLNMEGRERQEQTRPTGTASTIEQQDQGDGVRPSTR